MRTSIFRENERVLLVGEGNFSFAVSLLKLNLNIEIIATCYESSIAFESGVLNVEYLKNRGVGVLLGVDAAKLDKHFSKDLESFDKIIFNFPHAGGKMKIHRNRELLREFFSAAQYLIKYDGDVLVSLCNGQGGTPSDSPQRRWDDSWQIVEMAAHGNFLLTNVEPFLLQFFPDYTCVGYRSLEKGFANENSLVHIFRKTDKPDSVNISLRNASNFDLDSLDLIQFEGITQWRELVAKLEEKDCLLGSNLSSIYPLSFSFDITFSVGLDFSEIRFYATLYLAAGNVVENVEFLGFYRFTGSNKTTRTYRICYRSSCLPLHRKRVIDIHENLVSKILEDRLNVVVTK